MNTALLKNDLHCSDSLNEKRTRSTATSRLARYHSALWLHSRLSWLTLAFAQHQWQWQGSDHLDRKQTRCNAFPRCVIIFKTGWKHRFPRLLSHLLVLPRFLSDACWTENCLLQGLLLLFVPEVLKSLVLLAHMWAWGRAGWQWSLRWICAGMSSANWTCMPHCVYLGERKWTGSRHNRFSLCVLCLPMWTHMPARDSLWECTCLYSPHPFICFCCPLQSAASSRVESSMMASDLVIWQGQDTSPFHVIDTPIRISYLQTEPDWTGVHTGLGLA